VDSALIVLTTFADANTALRIARQLVDEQLAACVNVLGEIQSVYRWNGEVSEDREVQCLIKTSAAGFERLRARLIELHPYEIPELVALPVTAAYAPYLEWLLSSVRRG
jgi:periplasmic divalent cation tolerance protein